MAAKKVTDKELLNAYRKTRNVHKAGAILGIKGGSVHERLVRLGVDRNVNRWTASDDERLRNEYEAASASGKLIDLAKSMGRTKPFICRKARSLGLTNQKREKLFLRVWKGMSADEARIHFEKFKASSLTLGQYCTKKKIDDLGFSVLMRSHFPDEWEMVTELKGHKQTGYRLGRHVEYTVRDDLRKRGYFAMRSPRSAGPVDIVGIRNGAVLFVQAKRNLALPPSEWNALFEIAKSVGAIPLLAGRPTGKGLVYHRLLSVKDGTRKRQPMEPFEP